MGNDQAETGSGKYFTTRWNNVKGRALFLMGTDPENWRPGSEGSCWAQALCEEMDRMQGRIEALEARLSGEPQEPLTSLAIGLAKDSQRNQHPVE